MTPTRSLIYCVNWHIVRSEREGYWTGLARVPDMTMDHVRKEIRGEVKE